jgi:hypothetical protein
MADMRTTLWLGRLKVRDHSEDLGVKQKDNIKMDIKEIYCAE